MTHNERTYIETSIPITQYKKIDKISKATRIPRSKLIVVAINKYLDKLTKGD
jgi:hypothetical protein